MKVGTVHLSVGHTIGLCALRAPVMGSGAVSQRTCVQIHTAPDVLDGLERSLPSPILAWLFMMWVPRSSIDSLIRPPLLGTDSLPGLEDPTLQELPVQWQRQMREQTVVPSVMGPEGPEETPE